MPKRAKVHNSVPTPPPRHLPRESAASRGYDRRWRKARAVFLAQNALCAECRRGGIFRAAEVVDHITPHRGDKKLFWDVKNWQSLCKRCHDVKTASGG
jgi:5-methylcytosine-specific restriction protein A